MSKLTAALTRGIAVILLGVTSAASGPASAQETVLVRTSIEPEEDILVGQRVLYRLDVLGADGWTSLARAPRIELSGAFVYSQESQGIRLNETIDDTSYSGQRYELWIYPQRPGPITIPAITVNASTQVFGANAEATTKELRTQAVGFQVGLPPGATGDRSIVCSSQFEAEQRWQPAQSTGRVGDGILRTITRTVADVPAMALTPMSPARIPGIRAYPKQPATDDTFNRGKLTGRRTDSVTYVFEKSGKYELPQLTFSWWDLDAQELRTEQLPGLTVEVTPNGDAIRASSEDVTPQSTSDAPWATVIVVAMLLCGTALWFRAPLVVKLEAWIESYKASERSRFQSFVRAARTNDPRATLRTLMNWLDELEAGKQPAQLDAFLTEYGDADAKQATENLVLAAQARGNVAWDSQEQVKAIRRARKCYKSRPGAPTTVQARALPGMNPHIHNSLRRAI